MTGRERRTRVTAAALAGLVAGMVGLSFASVPLYRMFCQATGYGGTPKTEGVARPIAVGDDRNRMAGLQQALADSAAHHARANKADALFHFFASSGQDRASLACRGML